MLPSASTHAAERTGTYPREAGSLSVQRMLEYNESLEKDATPFRLCESLLEEKFEHLTKIVTAWDPMSWLTLARLNEMALFCAGNYADSCEFSAAGDLLVNPRLILVHIRGLREPVGKERHTMLTEQFRWVSGTQQGVIHWLKRHTTLETKKEPLLPLLYRLLENSGCISTEYLEWARARMEKIADVIGFLSAWNLTDSLDLYRRMQTESGASRAFIEENLCRFGLGTFEDLGRDLYTLARQGTCRSRFLS